MKPAPETAFLDLKRAAHYSSLSTKTLRRLVRSGKLPAYWAGGKILLKAADLDAWLTSRPVRPRVDLGEVVSRALGKWRLR